MNAASFLEILLIKLRVFLWNELLIKSIDIFTLFFRTDRTNTLSLFCPIEEHFILPFPWLINRERLHWSCVNKPFRTFAFVTFFAAHIIVIAFVASIIFAFVGNVVPDNHAILVRSFKILLRLYLRHFLMLVLMLKMHGMNLKLRRLKMRNILQWLIVF